MIRLLENNRGISLFLTLLIAVEIFYMSSIPGTMGVGGNIWMPVIYHFTIFFLFTFFLIITIKGNRKIKKSHILIAIIFSLSQAFLDEFHQFFVPLRSMSITDILTDSLGIFSAIIIYYLSCKKD